MKPAPAITRFRTQPATSAATRVDRAAGVIRGASAAQAVEALGHGVMLDDTTLAQVIALGNAARGKGLKVRFTHPGMCQDGLGTMIGHAVNFRMEGDKALCDIQLDESAKTSPKGDLYTYVLDLAEKSPEDFGLSIVFSGGAAWKLEGGGEVEYERGGPVPKNAIGELPYARVEKLSAVDAVDEPAANRDGLFAAAFSATGSAQAEQMFAALDELLASAGVDIDRAEEFAHRYLAARRPKPTTEPSAMKLAATVVLALAKQHPTQIGLIESMAAADKSEAEISLALDREVSKALAAEVESLKAKATELAGAHTAALGVESAKVTKLTADLAALQKKYDDLAALKSGTPKDPGGDPSLVGLAGEALAKAEFAKSPALQASYGGNEAAYVFARMNPLPVTAPEPAPAPVTQPA